MQRQLELVRSKDARAHTRVLMELDRALAMASSTACLWGGFAARLDCETLAQVFAHLRRRVRFTAQDDRELIGAALVGHLRG